MNRNINDTVLLPNGALGIIVDIIQDVYRVQHIYDGHNAIENEYGYYLEEEVMTGFTADSLLGNDECTN